MATICLTDASLVVNSVDLSDHVRSLTIDASADVLDDSAMGSGWRSKKAGAKQYTLTVEWNQDYAASEVDATLWAAYNAGANVTWEGKPTSAAVSATNPKYSGSIVPSKYTPISGAYGDLSTVSTSWEGSGALARATS